MKIHYATQNKTKQKLLLNISFILCLSQTMCSKQPKSKYTAGKHHLALTWQSMIKTTNRMCILAVLSDQSPVNIARLD